MAKDIYYYSIFGLTISSPFKVNYLKSCNKARADVIISQESFDTPDTWDKTEPFYTKPLNEELIINLKGDPYILVKYGEKIIINENVRATDQEREVLILASGLATILIQRDFLLLHGATILHKGEVIVFMGSKGVGKSTLSVALQIKGYQVLGDDICAIYTDPKGILKILKPPQTLKLTDDTIEKLSLEPSAENRHCDLKYWLKLPECEATSLPLSRIFALKTLPQSHISINPIRGIKALELILENLYRPSIVNGLEKWNTNFKLSSKLASELVVSEIIRPNQNFDIDLLVAQIEEHILN